MLEKYLGFPPKTHHYIYVFSTVLTAISLSVSLFGLSLGLILLGSNWIVEGKLKEKFERIAKRKSTLLALSIYFIFLLGILWSENFSYAIHDLKIKSPLFGLPIIFATMAPMNWKEIRIVLIFFVLAVIANSFISFAIYLGISGQDITDTRDISIFISHIRFALMIDMAIVILCYAAFTFNNKPWHMILILTGITWLVFFLFILNSYTGIIIIILVLPLVILYLFYSIANRKLFRLAVALIGLTIIVLLSMGGIYLKRFNTQHIIPVKDLKTKTVNGNLYQHKTANKSFENGHQTWVNVCEKELCKEWNRVSSIPYHQKDKKSQPVRHTLIRYLTSKGLTKDSVGVHSLTERDIQLIENGEANYLFGKKWSVYAKIYPMLWQWKMYTSANITAGHSATMRIDYFKTGMHVLARFPLFGTGTGDVEDQFKLQYKIDDSKLNLYFQKRAHNQLLTTFITLGLIGGSWVFVALALILIRERKSIGFLFSIFVIIAFFSMLNEDTLETHTGVSFIAFFFYFLLYNNPNKKKYAQD